MELILTFSFSLIACLIAIPIVKAISVRTGIVALPREDRWNQKITPMLGGVAIYFSVLGGIFVSNLLFKGAVPIRWGIIATSTIVFGLGLIDDLKKISPPAKLLGQMLAASIVVFLGYSTAFFTPRISSNLIAQIPNIILTFVWILGITNAINLLDNMDGLAGGISLITVIFLSYFFWKTQEVSLLIISLTLAGGILGFLLFNFPPAKIFLGDSGSLFLGFSLALLAIARQPQASNVFAVMGVPTLLFLLPILDTSLVTITRLLRGQSPAQGGRDHTSHRLIAFGLSERQTLTVLFSIAILSGIAATILESLDYDLSLALVPILMISLSILAVYLGRIKVVTSTSASYPGVFTKFMVEFTYKRKLLEIVLDFFLIGISYYLAFWTRFGLSLSNERLESFLTTLPIILCSAYISFALTGVYKGVWKYIGVNNLIDYGKSVLFSVILSGLFVEYLYSGSKIPVVIHILFGVFLFLGLTMTRLSFRVLDLFSRKRVKENESLVLIAGVGNAGEMTARWMIMNPDLGYKPIGFLDKDLLNKGRQIHGIEIVGSFEQIDTILTQKSIDGIVVTSDTLNSSPHMNIITTACHQRGKWIRALRLEFEPIE